MHDQGAALPKWLLRGFARKPAQRKVFIKRRPVKQSRSAPDPLHQAAPHMLLLPAFNPLDGAPRHLVGFASHRPPPQPHSESIGKWLCPGDVVPVENGHMKG